MRCELIALLAITAALYFWQLGRADIVTDESSLATRAIGMVDFNFGIEQPTPWQWVEKIPWWMHLSFHDHPPLVFLLQHYSIKLFGENPTAIRLPSVLAGIAAVIFVYLIGKQLYSPTAGLASAAIFAFTANHVWISRIGLQESILIALMLASAAAFLKAIAEPASFSYDRTKVMQPGKADPIFLLLSAALLGLAFLAKYLALILIPIFATIFLSRKFRFLKFKFWKLKSGKFGNKYDRNYVRFSPEILLAIMLFLAVASPVIIYNIQLYRTFGHFDFQFSLLFQQEVQSWQSRPGQESLGSLSNRITHFIPWLIDTHSPYFLVLAALGLIVIVTKAVTHPGWENHSRLLIALGWTVPFLLLVGPTSRFLTLLTPWLAIAGGYLVAELREWPAIPLLRASGAWMALVGLVVAIEAAYSYSSVIAIDPLGKKPWAHSELRRQAHSWGFNQLEEYLSRELADKRPEVAITFEFPFLRDAVHKIAQDAASKKFEEVAWGIVYNDNINLSASLWTFLRRIVYGGWPVASAENFRSGGAREFFRHAGVTKILFVNATDHALQDRTRPPTPDGNIMEAELQQRNAPQVEIKNPRGETPFRVYSFDL